MVSKKLRFSYFLLLCVTIDVLQTLIIFFKFLVSFISDLLKSIPFFEDLRKVEWYLKDSFFSTVALPVRPFWKDKVAMCTNLNVHFMCIYVMCVWVDISLAVNFRTPRWIFFLSPYLPSPILPSFPSSTASPFAAIAPPLCLQIAQRKQCENLFAQHPPPSSSPFALVIHSYLPLFIPLMIYVLHS